MLLTHVRPIKIERINRMIERHKISWHVKQTHLKQGHYYASKDPIGGEQSYLYFDYLTFQLEGIWNIDPQTCI